MYINVHISINVKSCISIEKIPGAGAGDCAAVAASGAGAASVAVCVCIHTCETCNPSPPRT